MSQNRIMRPLIHIPNGLFCNKKLGTSGITGGSITKREGNNTVKRALWADSQKVLCYGKSTEPKSPKPGQSSYQSSIQCIFGNSNRSW
jgi:hypothetical protein